MTEKTLGEAIRDARATFGRRRGLGNARRKISQEALYAACLNVQGAEKPMRNIDKGGRAVIAEWEKGDVTPTPAQCRVLEKALNLQPHEFDQYTSKAQLEHDNAHAAVVAAKNAWAAGPLRLLPETGPAESTAVPSSTVAEPHSRISLLGDVEPALAAGMRPPTGTDRRFAEPYDSDRVDTDIKALRRALHGDKRLIVVTGPPFLGKKAKVKGMLRLIAEHSDSLTCELPGEHGTPILMPIRAWSARRLHYRELVERVHDYLQHYHDAPAGEPLPSAPSLPMPEQGRALDDLIERINVNFRNLPAVFIFSDVDAFGANHARNVVRDIGIEQLIRTLLDANKASRIIITTSDFEERSANNLQFINFPPHLSISIKPPHFAEVQNFVRKTIRESKPLLDLYECNVRLRGDDLVALGALINLTYDSTSESLPDHVDTVIREFRDNEPEERNNARKSIYRQIVDAIFEHGLLHAVALAAASEDGVRPDSMRFLLNQWRKHNPRVVVFEIGEELNRRLEEFASLVGTRFLRRTVLARYDEEEYEYGEEHSQDDLVWEMDPILSMYFLDALRAFEPTVPAHAHRLIAQIARLRSQQKKVQMRSPIGSRASEEGSRDIQCYVNLLASIQFENGKSQTLEGKPLRLAEPEFFAIDDNFNPARALRFAVFCLLKEDIDHDHRLTMIFDEDALRLDLFLLLFQELGRVYTPEVERLDLPKSLPDHLTGGIFSPDEIIDLMSTIALSAYHAQRSTVVDDVVDMAADFARRQGIAWSSIELSRLWCCKIDASMRRGTWRDLAVEDDNEPQSNGRLPFAENAYSTKDRPGHLATLAFVRERRREWYPDLADKVPSKEIAPSDLSRHKAHLRLLIREADLSTLVDTDRSAAARLYELVEDTEAALSTLPDHHDPVVLSGRAGRRYIQFLLRDPAVLHPSDETNAQAQKIFAKVEALLSVNKSRLRRFSGADRVGVMLDMARLKLMRGDRAGANAFAESAKRRAFSGSVSHGGKLDVFQVLARVKLNLVEHGDPTLFPPQQDENIILRDAALAIRNLEAIASHLGYAPSLGAAYMLKARLELAIDQRRRHSGGVNTQENLNAAREAIHHSSMALSAIAQVNLDASLAEMDAEIRARRKAEHPS